MRTSYPDARRKLLRLKRPTTRMSEFWLNEIRASLHVISAIAKLYPKSHKRKLKLLQNAFDDMRSRSFTTNNGYDEGATSATETMVSIIRKHLFPLDDGWSFDLMSSFGDDLVLGIEVIGYKLNMDGYDDLLNSVLEDGDVRFSFPVMMGILWGWSDYSFDAKTVWASCNEKLGWGIPELPDFHRNDDLILDVKILRRRLKKHGLESVITLLEAVDGSTGNIFFDFDYEYWQPPTLNAENLILLHRAWEQAQPMLKECWKAERLLEKVPDAYKKLVDAYGESLRPRQKGQ